MPGFSFGPFGSCSGSHGDPRQIPTTLHFSHSVSLSVRQQGREAGNRQGEKGPILLDEHILQCQHKTLSCTGTHSHTLLCVCFVFFFSCAVEVYVRIHVSSHTSVRVKNRWDFGGLIWDWDRHHWIFYLLHASCSPMSHKAPRLWTKLVRVKAPQRRETEYLPRVCVSACLCVTVYVDIQSCPPPLSSVMALFMKWHQQ